MLRIVSTRAACAATTVHSVDLSALLWLGVHSAGAKVLAPADAALQLHLHGVTRRATGRERSRHLLVRALPRDPHAGTSILETLPM